MASEQRERRRASIVFLLAGALSIGLWLADDGSVPWVRPAMLVSMVTCWFSMRWS